MTLRDGEPGEKPALLPVDDNPLVPSYECESCHTILNRPSDPLARLICLYAENGDRTAMAELFDRRQYALQRAVRKIVGRSASQALVEHLVVQAMIDIMENATAFNCARPAWPWMRTLTEYACYDYFRALRRDRLRTNQLGSASAAGPPPDNLRMTPEPAARIDSDPQLMAEANERKRRINETLKNLPQLDRVIWKLHAHGRKNPVVAARLRMTVKAVTRKLHHVRNKIRATI